jgi:flavin reductase
MTTPDKQTFRDAMACVGAAVNIITTDGPAGLAGFTASAVCSVTDSPPTLLVCLNRGASVWPTFSENRTLCVNTLAPDRSRSRTCLAVKRRWRSALPPPLADRRHGLSASGGCAGRLTAASARWSASARTTFCFATLFRLFATRAAGLVWFDRGYHTLATRLLTRLKETDHVRISLAGS